MALFKIFGQKTLSDENLLLKYKQTKDTKYVGELYQRYTHISFGVCMKYLKNEEDAKDAVMQIFEKLMTDLLKHQVDFFQGWLHTYLRNYCLMQLRKPKKTSHFSNEQELNNSSAVVETQDEQHLEEKEILEENIERLEAAIGQLKDGQKQCVELFYLEEKSYEEITDITGYDYKKVKSYIQNGKRNLKILMSKNGQ